MNRKSLILALSIATISAATDARAQDMTFSMQNITGADAVEFGLGMNPDPDPIRINLVETQEPSMRAPFISSRSSTPTARLRDLIGHAEASHAGYDSIQHGARSRPQKRPTEMTLGEIFAWIKATPGQPHAIGRYQFIPNTLKALVRRGGITPQTRFSPALQDHLANMLLLDAGYESFWAGKMSQKTFMYNLAGIWAGLPLPSGRSRYHGHAGNRATISWHVYDTEMKRIFSRR